MSWNDAENVKSRQRIATSLERIDKTLSKMLELIELKATKIEGHNIEVISQVDPMSGNISYRAKCKVCGMSNYGWAGSYDEAIKPFYVADCFYREEE